MTSNHPSRKKVIIAGAGFAGINAAKILGRSRDVDVVVLDKKNHHLFQPLLYQVATASLSPSDIGTPIRLILAPYSNTQIFLEKVLSVDPVKRKVITDSTEHSYDYLILACGATHSYFGRTEWEELAPGLKTIEQALEIRRRILLAFEKAEKESDPEKQKRLLTFVIIGGGPTGVELAGAVSELSKTTVAREFRNIGPHLTRVVLIQSGDHILPSFHNRISVSARQVLESMGVTVLTGSKATRITSDGVWIGDEFVATQTVLWAAGVKPSLVAETLGVPLDRAGRVLVEPDLTIIGHSHTFVTGDLAHLEVNGNALPGVAPVAIQQGKSAAFNILRNIHGEARVPFRYHDKGAMAVIGRNHGVVETSRVRSVGFLAWLAWLFVHILYLVGHRNRLVVLINWGWVYITFKRGARLITSSDWKEDDVIRGPGQKGVTL